MSFIDYNNLNYTKKHIAANELEIINDKESSRIIVEQNNNNQELVFKDKSISQLLHDQNTYVEKVTLEKIYNTTQVNENEIENLVKTGNYAFSYYKNGKLAFKNSILSKNEDIYQCSYEGSDEVTLKDLVYDLEVLSSYNRIPDFGLVYDFQVRAVNFSNYKYANTFICSAVTRSLGYLSFDKLLNDEYIYKKNTNYLHELYKDTPESKKYPPYTGWLDDQEFKETGWISIDKIIHTKLRNEFSFDQDASLTIYTKKFNDRKKALIYLILHYIGGFWELNSSNKLFDFGIRIIDKTIGKELDIINLREGLRKIIAKNVVLSYTGNLDEIAQSDNATISTQPKEINDICSAQCEKISINKCSNDLFIKSCNPSSSTTGSVEDESLGISHIITAQVRLHNHTKLRNDFPDILNTVDAIHWTTGSIQKYGNENLIKLTKELEKKFGSLNYEVTNLNEERAFHYATGSFYSGLVYGGFKHTITTQATNYQHYLTNNTTTEEWTGTNWMLHGSGVSIPSSLGLIGGSTNFAAFGWGTSVSWHNKIINTLYSPFTIPYAYYLHSDIMVYENKIWMKAPRIEGVVKKHSVAGSIFALFTDASGKPKKSSYTGQLQSERNDQNKDYVSATLPDTNECIEGCALTVDKVLSFLSNDDVSVLSSYKKIISGICFNGTVGPPLFFDYKNCVNDLDDTFIFFTSVEARRKKTQKEIDFEVETLKAYYKMISGGEVLTGSLSGDNLDKFVRSKIDLIAYFEDYCTITDPTKKYPVKTIGTLYLGKGDRGIATGGKTAPVYYYEVTNPKDNLFKKYSLQSFNAHLMPIVNLAYEWNGIAWTRKEDMPEDIAYHCGVGDEKWSIYWGGLHSSIEYNNLSVILPECDSWKQLTKTFQAIYNPSGFCYDLDLNNKKVIRYTDFYNTVKNEQNKLIALIPSYNEESSNNITNSDLWKPENTYVILEVECNNEYFDGDFSLTGVDSIQNNNYILSNVIGVKSIIEKNEFLTHRSFIAIKNGTSLSANIQMNISTKLSQDLAALPFDFNIWAFKIKAAQIDVQYGAIKKLSSPNTSVVVTLSSDWKNAPPAIYTPVTINVSGTTLTVNVYSPSSSTPTTTNASLSQIETLDINYKVTPYPIYDTNENIIGHLLNPVFDGKWVKITEIPSLINSHLTHGYQKLKFIATKDTTNNNDETECVFEEDENHSLTSITQVPEHQNEYVRYDNTETIETTYVNDSAYYKKTNLCDILKNGFRVNNVGNKGALLYRNIENMDDDNFNGVWFLSVPFSIGTDNETFFINTTSLNTAASTNGKEFIYFTEDSSSSSLKIKRISQAFYALANNNNQGLSLINFGLSNYDLGVDSAPDFTSVQKNITNEDLHNFFPWNIIGYKGILGPTGVAEMFDENGNYWIAFGDKGNLSEEELKKKNKPHTNTFTIIRILKEKVPALFNTAVERVNIYTALLKKQEYLLSKEKNQTLLLNNLPEMFIPDNDGFLFGESSVRNREGFIELIHNLYATKIGIFDLFIRLNDHYLPEDYEIVNVNSYPSYIFKKVHTAKQNNIINYTNPITINNLPSSSQDINKIEKIEKFDIISENDSECLTCQVCQNINENDYQNKDWIVHHHDEWVSPLIQSPFSGVFARDGFDILLILNNCKQRWGAAVWSLHDQKNLWFTYKKHYIYIDQKNHHLVLMSLTSAFVIFSYREGVYQNVPVLNIYDEFIFNLDDYKKPDGEDTDLLKNIKNFNFKQNPCLENFIVYYQPLSTTFLLNNIGDPGCYKNTSSNTADFIGSFISYKQNSNNKFILKPFTVTDVLLDSLPNNQPLKNLLLSSIRINQLKDVEYTEWATNFVLEYKNEKTLETGKKENFFFKYNIPELGSTCFRDRDEINDQEIILTSWRRFQDSSGLGGDVPIFDNEKIHCGMPYKYFLGQKAFGNPDQAIICGGFVVPENGHISISRSMWEFVTHSPTFKWNRFVVNPEDYLNKNYSYRGIVVFDEYKNPVSLSSILACMLFDVSSPLVLERNGKAFFEYTDRVSVTFDPFPDELVQDKRNYSIILTPNDNVKVWWENKEDNKFTIRCEINKWYGYVDWRIIYILEIPREQLPEDTKHNQDTYQKFEEK